MKFENTHSKKMTYRLYGEKGKTMLRKNHIWVIYYKPTLEIMSTHNSSEGLIAEWKRCGYETDLFDIEVINLQWTLTMAYTEGNKE